MGPTDLGDRGAPGQPARPKGPPASPGDRAGPGLRGPFLWGFWGRVPADSTFFREHIWATPLPFQGRRPSWPHTAVGGGAGRGGGEVREASQNRMGHARRHGPQTRPPRTLVLGER